MATIISLAQTIESDYQDDIVGSVKVCRPDMASPIGASNVPYIKEWFSVADQTASGIVVGNLLVKAQTTVGGDFTILHPGCMYERNNDSSYALTVDGRNQLDNYSSFYRPFETENDNLWTHVLNYFSTTRGLIFIKKIDIVVGTPTYGHVSGQKIVGDGGETETTSYMETWVFKATYPWGTPGNIVSWKE